MKNTGCLSLGMLWILWIIPYMQWNGRNIVNKAVQIVQYIISGRDTWVVHWERARITAYSQSRRCRCNPKLFKTIRLYLHYHTFPWLRSTKFEWCFHLAFQLFSSTELFSWDRGRQSAGKHKKHTNIARSERPWGNTTRQNGSERWEQGSVTWVRARPGGWFRSVTVWADPAS